MAALKTALSLASAAYKVGPAGTIVGDTDAQTLSNKGLQDSTVYFVDEANSAKKLFHQVAGLTTSRTWTAQDVDGTVALLNSAPFTVSPTAPTPAAGDNSTKVPTTAWVRSEISAVINAAPGALDTLAELAAAMGNDASFATTMTTALAGKQPLDADLSGIAGVTYGANSFPYYNGSAWAAGAVSAFARTLLDDNDAPSAIATLGISNSLVPPGTIVPFAGFTLPAGWLWCDGAAVSRTTHANLLAMSTIYIGATGTSGNSLLSSATLDVTTWLPASINVPIEGANIPGGTVLQEATATTLQLSANVSASGFMPVRIFPWGNGNGSTTFNVPDLRGEFLRGLDLGRGIDANRNLASLQSDAFKAHTHAMGATVVSNTSAAGSADRVNALTNNGAGATTGTTTSTGGSETRPRNVAVPYIIKT